MEERGKTSRRKSDSAEGLRSRLRKRMSWPYKGMSTASTSKGMTWITECNWSWIGSSRGQPRKGKNEIYSRQNAENARHEHINTLVLFRIGGNNKTVDRSLNVTLAWVDNGIYCCDVV